MVEREKRLSREMSSLHRNPPHVLEKISKKYIRRRTDMPERRHPKTISGIRPGLTYPADVSSTGNDLIYRVIL